MSSPGPAPEGTTVEPETEINRRLLQRATISAGTFAQIPSVSTEIKFHTRNEGDRQTSRFRNRCCNGIGKKITLKVLFAAIGFAFARETSF